MNEVVELDLDSFITDGGPVIARLVKACGDVPPPRWGHAASTFEHEMFIFGGRNSDDLNDLYAFDMNNHTWR